MKFRKKPVVIEAMRFMGPFSLDEMREAWGESFTSRMRYSEFGILAVDTLEGRMYPVVGDWIIRGVRGEFYSCRPEIFEETHEPADAHGDGSVRADLQEMLGHVCDGGGERPCSQMWFQDVAERALRKLRAGEASGSARERARKLLDDTFTKHGMTPPSITGTSPLRATLLDAITQALLSAASEAREEERAKVELLRAELQYFVDRCEGRHPDGHIRSRTTYARFKRALELAPASQAKEGV